MTGNAESLLPRKKVDSGIHEKPELTDASFAMLFASACTITCLLAFMVPSWTLIWTSTEPAVAYWNGQCCGVLLIIPVLILGAHMYQVNHGPDRRAVMVAVVPSAILLLVMLAMEQTNIGFYDQELFSIDCDAFPQKAALQLEWEAAKSFFTQCLTDTAATDKSLTKDFLLQNFRIQDCTQYEEVYASHAKPWSYLSLLEERYGCTGFCIPGQQLWSKREHHKDSCSVEVSAAFRVFVAPRVNKALFMVLGILAISGIVFPVWHSLFLKEAHVS